MNKIDFDKRLLKYFVHIILSVIFPFLTMMIVIMVTGDREFGMVFGLLTAFLLLNIAYSFYFFKLKIRINVILGLFVTFTSIGATYLISLFKIKPDFDFYGIWTGLFVYTLTSILTWELLYLIFDYENSFKTINMF